MVHQGAGQGQTDRTRPHDGDVGVIGPRLRLGLVLGDGHTRSSIVVVHR